MKTSIRVFCGLELIAFIGGVLVYIHVLRQPVQAAEASTKTAAMEGIIEFVELTPLQLFRLAGTAGPQYELL
jgi:hypothetical protein